MDDYLYNIGGISSKTPIALPSKFKIFDAEKFDGTGDPKQHVRRYLSIAEMKGLDEKQTLHAFPLSLMGGASKWSTVSCFLKDLLLKEVLHWQAPLHPIKLLRLRK